MKQRLPVLVVVAALAAAAVVLDRTEDEVAPRTVIPLSVDGPVLPDNDAASTAWYCAEGTSTLDGRADETIIIANLSQRQVTATITVLPGGDIAPVSETVRVDGGAQRRVPVSEILTTPEPGVVVEVVGGPAVVEHELHGRNDIAVSPCAREPSKRWYFAWGDTARGTEQWLALLNPFGDDAVVDVTFLTDAGARQPKEAQGVVVPRRSRVSLAVHDILLRQDVVAISVRVKSGRVVAERSLRYDGSNGAVGLATSLGATATSELWHVPSGGAQAGVTRVLAIANFGLVSAQAEVRIRLDGETTLVPSVVDVPARSVFMVDTGASVPVGTGYAMSIRVIRGPAVVTEMRSVQTSETGNVGVATTLGSTAGSRRWVFAVGQLNSASDTELSVLNFSDRALTVALALSGDGASASAGPAVLAAPPGERVVFNLRELGVQPNQVVVVTAEGPIIVGREIQGGGVSLSPGVREAP